MLQWLLCYRSCCRPSFFGPIHAMRFNTGAQCFEPCPLKQWHDSFADSRSSTDDLFDCSLSLFPPHFDNAPRKRSSIFPTFFRFNDRGKWFLAPSCPCDTLARVTSFSTVLTFVKNAKSVNLVHNFFSLEQSRRLCAIVSGSLSFFFFFFFLFSPPDRRLER